MKKIVKRTLVSFLIFIFSLAPISPQALLNINISQAAETIDSPDPVVWDTPKNINGFIKIKKGSKLILKENADLTFIGEYGGIVVSGELVIEGSMDNNVIINKSEGSNYYIAIEEESTVNIKHAVIDGGGYDLYLVKGISNKALAGNNYLGALQINGGSVMVEDTTFKNNLYAVIARDNIPNDKIKINFSKFIDNDFDVEDMNGSDFTNNYWDNLDEASDSGSDESCVKNKNVSSCLSKSYGDFIIHPWQTDENFTHSGGSSVLFLPGIKASHLYKYDSDTDHDLDELWVPNWLGNDVDELMLDSDGKSIEKVFTREDDVLKDTVMGKLYESFLADLDKLKTDKVIDNYKAFAYDWRQSVEDIAKNGTPYENNQIKSIKTEIENLAQTSKTGKVTIVAHSNGGLVAKATMINNPELAEKVDKIILVASPQMGTPLVTLSLLYGYEESLPTLLSQEEARSLVENMPGAYGLLPSDEYLERLKAEDEALINFPSEKNSERGEMFYDAYGERIDDINEFRDFLLSNNDNREKPETNEVNLENIFNEKLLDESIDMHSELDDWTPPSSVKVIQLGGWGLPTISGIDYVEKKKGNCTQPVGSSMPVCKEDDNYSLIYEPKIVLDGDAVVTTPSALNMVKADNVERYWFDIKSYNKGLKVNRMHKDIFEAGDVRDFIKNEIQNENPGLPKYIQESRPDDHISAKPQIRMSLYSPLDIHLESDGKHTGLKEIQTEEGLQRIIEENIPNSYYFQLGERKYLGFEEGDNVEVKLDGYAEGPYTLKIEEIQMTEEGETVTNDVTFKNLPTSEKTEVKITIPASGLKDISNLEADYDRDGTNDYTLAPIMGGEVTLPDVTPPVIKISSPESKTYLKNEMLDISYVFFDDRSAAENIKVEKLFNNQIITQDKVDLALLKTGQYKLIIKATDEADNSKEEEKIFNVNTNIIVLKENVDHFYNLKLIKSNQERKMLINNLSVIEREIEFYNSIKNNLFIKSKVKKILLNIMERQIENHIDIISSKIERDRRNYVTIIKEIIVSDLGFIKDNIK